MKVRRIDSRQLDYIHRSFFRNVAIEVLYIDDKFSNVSCNASVLLRHSLAAPVTIFSRLNDVQDGIPQRIIAGGSLEQSETIERVFLHRCSSNDWILRNIHPSLSVIIDQVHSIIPSQKNQSAVADHRKTEPLLKVPTDKSLTYFDIYEQRSS
jgi:hypothetical protein